jgi:hypothetical protein
MDFLGFFQALLSHWVLLMSGTASVILTVIGFARNWANTPRWAVGITAAICFFLAIVGTWTTENRKFIAEQEKNKQLEKTLAEQFYPALEGEILNVGFPDYLTPNKLPNKVRVAVMAYIRNTGMDSFVDGWTFSVSLPDGRTEKTEISYKVENEKFRIGHKGFTFTEKDALDSKLPVKRGDKIGGILIFEFNGLPRELLAQKGSRFTLSFKDVRGKLYQTLPSEIVGIPLDTPLIFRGTNPAVEDIPAQ